MNYEWAFLPMDPSTELLGDRDALRDRFEADGYLYFPKLLDRRKIVNLRRTMLTTLRESGWIDPESILMRGRTAVRPAREGSPEFFEAYDEIQKLEDFHELAHDPTLVSAMREVLGDTAFPHPLKVARLIFPLHYEVSTPPHQDYLNNQGTENLTAAWIPVGDLSSEMGGIAVLRGSHRWGCLPRTTHLGAGNRRAILPDDMLRECRWVTTDFEMGDVLVFPSLTVHAGLNNVSEFWMRLSVDFRYQQEGEDLTEACLEPHFGRLAWEDIYEGWSDDAHRYYWRDLDFGVVPFEKSDLDQQIDELDEAKDFYAYERRLDHRMGESGPENRESARAGNFSDREERDR